VKLYYFPVFTFSPNCNWKRENFQGR